MVSISQEKHKHDLVMRLKRIEGQLRAIRGMIEAEGDCEEVAQQLAASRKALDKAFFNMLACAIQADPARAAGRIGLDARLQHAADLLAKFG